MQESFNIPSIKIVHYRNAIYQGLIDSLTQERHGFGILLDDDLNLYCSEWSKGKLNGVTFIYLNHNESYLYGQWSDGQPQGINVYRDKEGMLYANYLMGMGTQTALALDDKITMKWAFCSEKITSKACLDEIESFSQKIYDSKILEDIILQESQKSELMIDRTNVSVVNYLKEISRKHTMVNLINKDNIYYFGFQNGLGLKFTLSGFANHQIKPLTLGCHQKHKITELGIKYYDNYSYAQEGNFITKQTISYNKYTKRPHDECHLIYKNIHRKSLNFVNKYFQFRNKVIEFLQVFSKKMFSKYNGDNKLKTTEMKVQNEALYIEKSAFYQRARQDFAKATQSIKQKKNIRQTKSIVNLQKNKQHSGNSQKKMNSTYQIDQEKREYQEMMNHAKQYSPLKYKKQTTCNRCLSRQKRPYSFVNKKSISRSIDKTLTKKQNKTQIKYLKNYHDPNISIEPFKQEDLNKSGIFQKKSQNNSIMPRTIIKNQRLILKTPEKHIQSYGKKDISRYTLKSENEKPSGKKPEQTQYKKQTTQQSNQVKIREQIIQRQQKKQLRSQAILNRIEQKQYQDSVIQRMILQQRDFGQSIFQRSLQQEYSYNQTALYNRHPLTSLDTGQNNYMFQLENRRELIVRQLQILNKQLNYEHSLKTELVSSRKQILQIDQQNRQRVEQFNKRYRGYLPNGSSQQGGAINQIEYRPSYTQSQTTSIPIKKSPNRGRYQYVYEINS